MTTSNQLFATELTDGSQFRLYQKISWYLMILFFILSLGFTILSGKIMSQDNVDIIQHPFAIFTYSLLAISLVFYIYSRIKKPLGTLKIFDDKIEIQEKSAHTYDFNQLSNFEIQRGSTYHYTHQTGNEIVKVSNYLRFNNNGESKEYEFLIDSKKKNAAFESMIYTLLKNRIKLYYTSI